jgi:hypothetical protein
LVFNNEFLLKVNTTVNGTWYDFNFFK